MADDSSMEVSESTSESTDYQRGYPLAIADKQMELKFMCSHCRMILRRPFQAYCGHRFCKECLMYLVRAAEKSGTSQKCRDCVDEGAENEYSVLQTEQMFPDNALNRELNQISVHCINKDCGWKGLFKEYQTHEKECKHREEKCTACKRSIRISEFSDHHKICDEATTSCDVCGRENIKRKELPEHQRPEKRECFPKLDNPVVAARLFQRLKQLEAIVQSRGLSTTIQSSSVSYTSQSASQPSTSTTASYTPSEQASDELTRRVSDISAKFYKADPAESKVAGLSGDVGALARVLEDVSDRIKQSEDIQQVLTDEIESCVQRATDIEMNARSLEAQLQAKTEELKKIEELYKEMAMSSYGGVFLWKLDNVKQRHADARAGKVKGIYSPPFYTSKTGYKMCLRLFLNGDGQGHGTHISVFFVLLKGEYDALLPWPFKQRVTIMLLDQDRKEDIIDNFIPDRKNPCFGKPVGLQNVGTGYPMFAQISQLESPNYGYLKDDCMFIKVVVDTSGLID